MGSNVLHKDRLAYLTMKGWGNEQRQSGMIRLLTADGRIVIEAIERRVQREDKRNPPPYI